MVNLWVEHIRQYAKDNNLSYACALSTPQCKNTYIKTSSKSKSKKKTDCKTCKINKEPHKMYESPIGPKKQYTQEELLIMAKNIVSYVTKSDQYLSSYDKNWNKKSKEDLLKIVSNFKKKYPDITIKKTPITMSTLQLLG